MLVNKQLRDGLGGKPDRRIKKQISYSGENILTHTDVKGPHRQAIRAEVAGEEEQVRIVGVSRIISDVCVKKDFVAEDEVAKNDYADQEQAEAGEC